jgi:hypothetical protein
LIPKGLSTFIAGDDNMSAVFAENLGVAAGKVWSFLKDAEAPMSATKLAEGTGLDKNEVQRAIGWLAREGKIAVDVKGKNEFFSLLPD